jgi:glycosyltransferase involved in cell wall biosynthesis
MAPRLLFVVNHAGFFLSHRLPIALAARDAGFDTHIATPRSRRAQAIVDSGLPWHEIGIERSGINPVTEAATIARLAALYRRLRPQIVHHVTSKPVLYGTPVARATGVPAVVNAIAGMGHAFSHDGSASALMRVGLSTAYRFALTHPRMRAVFQNEQQRDEFVQRGWVSSSEAVLIRGAGVDTERFALSPRNDVAQPTVMFASRMLKAKGILDFISAIRLLRARGVDARYVLVGDADPDNPGSLQESELEAWRDEGLVEYWGRCEDMPQAFAQADIVALPTYYPEGVPKVLIEAAACGLPIVTTPIPGCRDLVTDGVNGLIVPIKNPLALADALERLIRDRELRERLGAAGRERVVADYALSHVIDAHLELYRGLAG